MKVDSGQWSRVKEIFQQAVDRPPEDRSRFVREACGGDPDLFAAVNRLLVADQQAEDVPVLRAVHREFPGLFSTESNEATVEPAHFLPGTLLAGRYRIVALIGRGGMGDVYRADDLRLAQSVALKFLPERVAGDPERL